MKITDHKMVYCTLKWKKEKPTQKLITYRDFSKFNQDLAVNELAGLDWENVKKLKNVDDIEQSIKENMTKVYDKHAPLVTKKITRRKAAWKTVEIKTLSVEKRKLRNKFWKFRSVEHWENYKLARNRLNKMVWNAKREFFAENLTSKKNPKEFWDCIKQNQVSSKSVNSVKLPLALELDDVNKFFAEMGSDSDVDHETLEYFWKNKRDELTNCQAFAPVTENDVKLVMNEIKSRAVGSDGISIRMIKAASPFAIGAITHLMNMSLESGVFPKAWKLSIVRPLPKVPTPTTVEQLRPISILPAMSKILEKLVIRQIMTFVNSAKILPTLQSGFRKNHSTCTALTNLMSDMIDAKDKGRLSSLVLLDYSKAFDSMHHEMLLAKMHFFGFSERMVQWVRSYLGSRLQVTKVGRETSRQIGKARGVPQGSCLGPILFSLYTADFPECLQNCNAHLYADDTQLLITYEPLQMESAIVQLNSDLDNVVKWSVANGLRLNVNKCTVLHTAPHQLVQAHRESGSQVMLGGQGMSVCDTVKTLGLVLDGGLTFSDHVTHCIQRAVGRLRGLYRFKNMLPEHAKLQLMQSLILSAFYYCYPVYGNSISGADTERIQKLQNSAIRFIFNLKKFDHVSTFRDALNMLPMKGMCELLTCCMVNKVLSLKEPQYLSDRLTFRGEVSQRTGRHGDMLHFPRVERELGRGSFSYFGPALYNCLPRTMKENISIPSFKKKIKVYLTDG